MTKENDHTLFNAVSSFDLGLSQFIRKMRKKLNLSRSEKGLLGSLKYPKNESVKAPREDPEGQITGPTREARRDADFDPDNDDDFVVRQ